MTKQYTEAELREIAMQQMDKLFEHFGPDYLAQVMDEMEQTFVCSRLENQNIGAGPQDDTYYLAVRDIRHTFEEIAELKPTRLDLEGSKSN